MVNYYNIIFLNEVNLLLCGQLNLNNKVSLRYNFNQFAIIANWDVCQLGCLAVLLLKINSSKNAFTNP